MVTVEDIICPKCEEAPAVMNCSCRNRFCKECFYDKHLPRYESHQEILPSKKQEFVNWALGKTYSTQSYTEDEQSSFQKDETRKWFGLIVEESEEEKIPKLVETPRFRELVEKSTSLHSKSPKKQYPSLISFVGETGVGKSTLIRLLIRASNADSVSNDLEAPVPGSRSEKLSSKATTGEVNLYFDPDTFGTESPAFFVDCEGLSGGEPIASRYQSSWSTLGRSYLVENNGQPVDRDTAVKDIYPKFLYLFSDVVCMVTKNPKANSELARKVLEWGQVGARNAVNQYSLPALVVIINGQQIETSNSVWLSDDLDAATKSFFDNINQEIKTNAVLQTLAKKNGVESMSALFERYYSSVHVYYIPLESYGLYGTGDMIMQQVERLRRRILSDSNKVQRMRAKKWIRYDAKLLSMTFHHAFEHLASRTTEAFDFNLLRQQATLPESTEIKITSFLNLCLRGRIESNFQYASKVIASSFVRLALKTADIDTLSDSSTVYSATMRAICQRSAKQFLDACQPCAFVDDATGRRCVNTKNGHVKGHQDSFNAFLIGGNFVNSEFNPSRFLENIEAFVESMLKDIIDQKMDHTAATNYLAQQHKHILQSAPNREFWFDRPHPPTASAKGPSNSSLSNLPLSCYGCLFGRPEYRFPCGHYICECCLIDFKEQEQPQPDHVAIHRECIMCKSPTLQNGYKVPIRPQLSGTRILSLDGGGVRGIIPLITLQRLEKMIGIDLPVGQFFDLIVGTSAGGLIALGLGKDKLSTTQYIDKFKGICKTGFKPRILARVSGYLSGLFSGSIYDTVAIEEALQSAYEPEKLFGLSNVEHTCFSSLPRVAVTTIVGNDCWLLANYNQGDNKRYLKSAITTYEAARATSAVPLYFEPFTSAINGTMCRDGGLYETNTSAIALSESRELWGESSKVDLLLSLGSGTGAVPTSEPSGIRALPPALATALKALLGDMDGESAWKRFSDSVESRIQQRARRLNPKFRKWETEPRLDSIDSIEGMTKLAKKHFFRLPTDNSPFRAVLNRPKSTLLETAFQLRASLYYFHLDSISRNMAKGIAVVKGYIHCRLLLPEQDANFKKLIDMTTGFSIDGNRNIPIPDIPDGKEMKVPVSIVKQLRMGAVPIRIDAIFDDNRLFAISGFPATIEELYKHSNRRK